MISADWFQVYAYISSARRRHRYNNEGGDYSFVPSRLVFCDDGSHQPGNNPEHALNGNPDDCWCTNAFVDHDVDLVADLTVPHLVLALEVANGNSRFSAPVKEALAFCSLDMPNLEQAREYDGARGIALAREISEQTDFHRQPLPPGHPIGGFAFPGIPRAYRARLGHPALRPTVARFVHWKLLTSSKCVHRVSNNIDVCSLHAFGVALPDLSQMIGAAASNNNTVPPDPSRYTRQHKIRDYPWHIHDAFHPQEMAQIGEHRHGQRRLQRLDELLEENQRHLQQLEDLVALRIPPDDNNEEEEEEVVEEQAMEDFGF